VVLGIRVALGALQRDVLWMVMQQVVVLSGVGLAVGGLLAFALSSLIRIQLYGLQPHDPFTYVSAAAVLALAAFAAGFRPKEATNNFAWYRNPGELRIADIESGRSEPVVRSFPALDCDIGLKADDTSLLTRNTSSQEVYALDWDHN
jgi:hypothetical protein